MGNRIIRHIRLLCCNRLLAFSCFVFCALGMVHLAHADQYSMPSWGPEAATQASQGTPTTQPAVGSVADDADAELAQLARSLDYDPRKIYDWIRNNVTTEFYAGCRRGALLTYMDLAGNDADQVALMGALLKASGYSPTYCTGNATIPRSNVGPNKVGIYEWLGVNDDALAISLLSRHGPSSSFSGNSLTLTLKWLTISKDGQTITFLPSVKPTQRGRQPSLDTFSGYNYDAAVAASGAKLGLTYKAQAIDRSSLRNYLTARTKAASESIKASPTFHDLSAAELIGLPMVVPEASSIVAPTATSYPSDITLQASATYTAWPNAFNSYMQITVGIPETDPNLMRTRNVVPSPYNINIALSPGDIKGKLISIDWESMNGQPRVVGVGGDLITTTFPSAPTKEIGVEIRFADGIYYRSYPAKQKIAILYSFGRSVGRLSWLLKKFSEREAPGGTIAEFERLQLLLHQYAAQQNELATAAARSIGADYQRTLCIATGIMDSGKARMDLQVLKADIKPLWAMSAKQTTAATRMLHLLSGAIEGAVMEQMTNFRGFGAPTLFDWAPQECFYLNRREFQDPTIRKELGNLTGRLIANVEAFLGQYDSGRRVFLMKNSLVSYNNNSYSAWLLLDPSGSTGTMIADYAGGMASAPFSNELITKSVSTSNLSGSNTVPTVQRTASSDPVDLSNGAFMKRSNDLTVGQTEPNGLTLTRIYSSARTNVNPAGLGRGWTHNYSIQLSERSAVDLDCQRAYIDELIPIMLAARYTFDALDGLGHEPRGWMIGCSAVTWAADQQLKTRMSLTAGDTVMEFIKRPDGQFISPGNTTATLTRQGDGSHTLAIRHGNTLTFRSSDGRFTSIKDPFGNTLSAIYNGNNQLATVKDSYNRSFGFNYDGAGRLYRVDDSTGRNIRYDWNDSTLTYTDPEGKTEQYVGYGANLIRIIDGRGRTIVENDYDLLGKVWRQRAFGDSAKTSIIGTAPGLALEKDPAGGRSWTYFDARGRPVISVDGVNNTTATEYDGVDRLVSITTPEGNITSFQYNSAHVLVKVTDPAGNERTITPDTQNRPWKISNFEGKQTVITYTDQHRVKTITSPGNIMSEFQYDSKGRLWKLHAAAYAANSYDVISYDSYGNVDKITRPVDGFDDYTFNSRGDLLDYTDRSGVKTSFTYNNRRQLTSYSQYDEKRPMTSYTYYDDSGDVDYTTDASGRKTDFEHDALGQLLTVAQGPEGAQVTVLTNSYNSRNLLWKTVNAFGQGVEYGYDDAQRPTTVKNALGYTTTLGYDKDSRGRTLKTPLQYTTTQVWESRSFLDSIQDAEQQIIDNEFDKDGRIKTLANRLNKSFTWTYDDDNRKIEASTPLGRKTTVAFNTRGLPDYVEEPSLEKTSYTEYDSEGKLRKRTDPVATTTYTYYPNGLLKEVSELNKTTVRKYDTANRLKEYQDGEGNTITYTYYDSGELKDLGYPGGKTVTYEYDDFGRLWHVKDWAGRVTTYSYDDAGRLRRLDRHNRTYRLMGYDDAGQIRRIRDYSPDGSLALYQQLGYDSDSRIDKTLRYPASATAPLPLDNLTYNDDNELDTWNDKDVVCDADGNMTTGPVNGESTSTLVYNSRNQLLSAGDLLYKYNPDGIRSAIYGNSNDALITDPSTSPTRVLIRKRPDKPDCFYIYGNGLLYEEASETTRCYVFDNVGNTVALSDDNGAVCDTFSYSPFGLLLAHTGDSETSYLFCGEFGVQTDNNSLLYMQARYYSPRLMRFISADPSKFGGGTNWYAYVSNNPLIWIDPMGLEKEGAALSSERVNRAFDIIERNRGLKLGEMSIDSIKDAQDVLYVMGLDPGASWPRQRAVYAIRSIDNPQEVKRHSLVLGVGTLSMVLIQTASLPGFRVNPMQMEASTVASESVWALRPFARGGVIERILGANLPRYFPVFDKFKNGIATSIKSLDLAAESYQIGASLERRLNGFVDSVRAFKGATLTTKEGTTVTLRASQITAREVQVVIPRGITITPAQQAAMNAAQARAQSMGIKLFFTPFP